MANLIESKFLSETNMENNGGVFHVKGFFKDSDARHILSEIETIEYKPLLHEGKIARYECDYSFSSSNVLNLEASVRKLAHSLGISFCEAELYCFKYITGHSVPWHQDMDRHLITAIAYFGDFSGGEYVYKDRNEKIVTIEPKQGDVVVSVNALPGGMVFNPLHKVNEIEKGVRYCAVVSITSSKQSNGIFSS